MQRLEEEMRARFRGVLQYWTDNDREDGDPDGEVSDLFDMLNEGGFLTSPVVWSEVRKLERPNL